jgi:hypothetical protein
MTIQVWILGHPWVFDPMGANSVQFYTRFRFGFWVTHGFLTR